MRLNLPILDQLVECQNVLIAGMGGGFDVFCGLPIYFELRERGYNVHLASLTHASLKRLRGARRLLPTLIGITASTESSTPYFPELHLMRWFKESQHEDVLIWCFERMGVQSLIQQYRALISHLSIDALLLVDGGIDSLIRGDEIEIGSPQEDAANLAAVNALTEVKTRLLCCVGFGAELEMDYAQVLENIAEITANDGLLGVCALTKQMPVYQRYEAALLYAQDQQRQDASVINSSVVSAVQGHFGDYHLTDKTAGHTLHISPFMSLYWFFHAARVADQSLLVPLLTDTHRFEDVQQKIGEALNSIPRRAARRLNF